MENKQAIPYMLAWTLAMLATIASCATLAEILFIVPPGFWMWYSIWTLL